MNYIWVRDKSTCIYCGAPAQAIDHVVPRKEGGPEIQANKVLACTQCNSKKSGSLNYEFLIKALYYLLSVGEDISWIDSFAINEPLQKRFELKKKCRTRKRKRRLSLSHDYLNKSKALHYQLSLISRPLIVREKERQAELRRERRRRLSREYKKLIRMDQKSRLVK